MLHFLSGLIGVALGVVGLAIVVTARPVRRWALRRMEAARAKAEPARRPSPIESNFTINAVRFPVPLVVMHICGPDRCTEIPMPPDKCMEIIGGLERALAASLGNPQKV